MKHPMLRQLFQEWNALRESEASPERAQVSPAAIAGALPDTLMLAFDAPAGHPVRLAGSRVCALFGRELRGQGVVDLFGPTDREAAALLIAEIADSQSPALAALVGSSAENGDLDLELLLLPMRVDGATHVQMFCGLAAWEMPWWLAGDPLRNLRIRSVHHIRSGLGRQPFRSCVAIGKGAA